MHRQVGNYLFKTKAKFQNNIILAHLHDENLVCRSWTWWFLWFPSNLRYFMTVWNTWHVLCSTGCGAGRCTLSYLYLYGWFASCSGVSGSIHPLLHTAADHRAGLKCSIFWCLDVPGLHRSWKVWHTLDFKSCESGDGLEEWEFHAASSRPPMVEIGKPCPAPLAWLCRVQAEQQQHSCAVFSETGSHAWQS